MKPNTRRLPMLLWVTLGCGASVSCFAQGPLTPPGAPAPTMKTLQQVEPRTPISSAPFTITQPGSYYLTTNLTVSSGNAITIATNGVTLDLNGWTIRSAANPASGTAILLGDGLRDVTILNGHIQGGVTNNGSGIYSGPGFGFGINYSGTPSENVRVSGVSVSGCLYRGMYLYFFNSTLVENCTVQTVGELGIYASTIKSCVARDCGGTAITGVNVSDCQGQSSGSGYGVYASATALNCYGFSISGPAGLYALNAAFCVGYRSGGRAIQATIANGCYDLAGTNFITYKYNMP